jgi:hypothetical protein
LESLAQEFLLKAARIQKKQYDAGRHNKQDIKACAKMGRRYGYRRITALLRKARCRADPATRGVQSSCQTTQAGQLLLIGSCFHEEARRSIPFYQCVISASCWLDAMMLGAQAKRGPPDES